jgi:GntR family transcriptional repressor for pyruvate dehydrogenase complex
VGGGLELPGEAELARRLGVGRSTVREAIRALAYAGLLETRQGSGTFVRSVTPVDGWQAVLRRAAMLEVFEVRQALEVQAARLVPIWLSIVRGAGVFTAGAWAGP